MILKWQHFYGSTQFNAVNLMMFLLLLVRRGNINCLIQQLGLKVDELGILRCYGRFLNVEVNENARYPKLLPRHVRFTYLLIMEVHERLIHAGIAQTLAQVHEEYWIPKVEWKLEVF